MLITKEQTGVLIVNTEKLDVWLSRFFSRLESYAQNTGGASEVNRRAIGALAGLVVECVGENINSTITTNTDVASGVGAVNVCHLSINEDNMCLSLALAAFERGQNLPTLSNVNCLNNL